MSEFAVRLRVVNVAQCVQEASVEYAPRVPLAESRDDPVYGPPVVLLDGAERRIHSSSATLGLLAC